MSLLTLSTYLLSVPMKKKLRGYPYPYPLAWFTGSPPLPSPASGTPCTLLLIIRAVLLAHTRGTRFAAITCEGAPIVAGWRPYGGRYAS
jgi:hypothetical protein